MMSRQRQVIRRVSLAAAAAAFLVPVTVSPGRGVEPNDACASGNCCRELNSLCIRDGTTTLHYYQEAGPCPGKNS